MSGLKNKIPSEKLTQRDILDKYGNHLKQSGITKEQIAFESNTSPDTVRKVFIGLSHNKHVLEALKNLFLQVPQFKGKLPTDLKNMFKKSLSIQEKVN